MLTNKHDSLYISVHTKTKAMRLGKQSGPKHAGVGCQEFRSKWASYLLFWLTWKEFQHLHYVI